VLPELFWGEDAWTTSPNESFALMDAAIDFQHRWNLGEWFHGDDKMTRQALSRLLDVR
jgi:hypothetical protein